MGLPNFAFIGKAGAGKSTAAAALGDNYVRVSFAGPLKDIAANIWGDEARTDRGKLQGLGNAVRQIDEDAWANLWTRFVKVAPFPVVTDDLRFPNEWLAARSLGFVIVRILAGRDQRIARLTASGKLQDEAQLEHISETALDDRMADYTIDGSGSVVDLTEQVFEILDREQRRR